MNTSMRSLAFAAAISFSSAGAFAATITDGFTFSVASFPADTSVGTHFHSSTGGDFGNPAGKSEVGSFSGEEVRGLSEYDLSGLSSSASAFVTFDVFSLGGLFAGTNDFLYDGPISVVSYVGNNLEDISDYEIASSATVGSFLTGGLAVGNTLSFDITSIFNAAIADGDGSLGIRLAISGAPNGGAATFDTFRLTSDDQSTMPAVPLPAGFPLLFTALAGLGFLRHRKSRG